MKKTISAMLALLVTAVGMAYGQSKFEEVMSRGSLSGNIQIDAQIYQKDSAIGAQDVPEKFRSNSYAYLQYTNGRFSMGARFEGYFKPMLGYEAAYDGAGIPYYFARFSGNMIDVTVGNFYEQFGSGMLLRAYQDWNLGLDNSIFGARAVVTPTEGITIKGIVGTQRHFWDRQGLIRGIDADLSFNDFIKPMRDWETRIRIGGSFVSKYQDVQDITVAVPNEDGLVYNYSLNLPKKRRFGGRPSEFGKPRFYVQRRICVEGQRPDGRKRLYLQERPGLVVECGLLDARLRHPVVGQECR